MRIVTENSRSLKFDDSGFEMNSTGLGVRWNQF